MIFRSLLAIFILLVSLQVGAAEPTTEPLLRVEPGMHTGQIRRLAYDPVSDRMFTCSDDKTIRIWQMPEKKLIATLRVPIDKKHEGQLFALAVSPDGKLLAAGGWTGWDWEQKGSVYLFDTDSGELVRRLSGFKDAIGALSWSPDGDHLAVGLQGRAGLDIVRVSDGKTVAADNQYLDKLLDLDFAANGYLLSVSLDGMVRLYNKSFKLIGRKKLDGGDQPITIRFTPDSKRFAIGFNDKPRVFIGTTKNLQKEFLVNADDISGQVNLTNVAWSRTGDFLYAGGDFQGKGKNPIYRWSLDKLIKGKNDRLKIPVSNLRIAEIRAGGSTTMAFVTEDPGLGLIDVNGKVIAYQKSEVVDFSQSGQKFLLSTDGLTIRYPLSRENDFFNTFSAIGSGDQSLTQQPQIKLYPPNIISKNFKLADWKNSYKLMINGKRPLLDDYEMSRSYAVSPDDQKLLLGTEWAVRLLDKNVKEIWHQKLPAVAWNVNISRNGRLAVAALSDGTIRWYDMKDGKQVLAYFPVDGSKEWIAWLTTGYYVSSLKGDNYIGWHFNRGKETNPDFYHAVQFDRLLYRPDIIKNAVKKYSTSKDSSLDLYNVVENADFEIELLRAISPPRVLVKTELAKDHAGETHLKLDIRAEKTSLEMLDYVVYLNNIPVTKTADRKLKGKDRAAFTREITIPLVSRDNQIRVEVFNGTSMGVAETFVRGRGKIKKQLRGDLYILAIGVNTFTQLAEGVSLAFAVNDAERLVNKIARFEGGYFKKIHTHLITDQTSEKPRRKTIEDALTFLHQAQSQDTVILFLASHGISDKQGNYYFVPQDATAEDIEKLLTGGKIESLVSWESFFDAFRLTAGKRLLIVDTCQAQNIEGRFDAHSLMKRSASSLFTLMLASKGNEQSQEYPPAGHGLFTYAFLESYEQGRDQNKDGLYSVSEMFSALEPIVRQKGDFSHGSQTPQLVAPDNVDDIVIRKLN